VQKFITTDVDNLRENFSKGACWFDATEAQKDREYSISFPRTEEIYNVLWDLHSFNGKLDDSKLISSL